ncbi:MAG: arginase family protein [Hyphomicrobiales bacterium]|nr:arginase family protein [Hyphomicrobiales bacterium]
MAQKERDIGMMYGSRDTATFLGLPSCPDLKSLDAGIAILGIGCATPYASVGAYCADAPAAIRATMARYSAMASHYDFDLEGPLLGPSHKSVVDCGDLDVDEADAAANRRNIKAAISTVLDRGAVPVVIGGDDSVPIPMFQAFEGRGRYTILQLDAHIDFRDEVDGEHLGLSSTMRRASELPFIESIIAVGQRNVGSARPADYEEALARGVKFISGREIQAKGIGRALDFILPGSNVLITFDCDALDPSIMPSVIGRAPGGLSYWQAIELISGVAERARIAAFDLVEFMPSRDVSGMGALTAGRILANVIGLLARDGG